MLAICYLTLVYTPVILKLSKLIDRFFLFELKENIHWDQQAGKFSCCAFGQGT